MQGPVLVTTLIFFTLALSNNATSAPSHAGCESFEFKCSNTNCTSKTWWCDGEDDCGDNSDEENCVVNPTGCRYNQFQCKSGNQCVPKSFHCDLLDDCEDGTDELGCSPPSILVPPTPLVELDEGAVFNISCTAIGVPTPEVSWRLNLGQVPAKCTQVSENGVGRLECRNIEHKDQGAYSCNAYNGVRNIYAEPASILVVKQAALAVQPGGI